MPRCLRQSSFILQAISTDQFFYLNTRFFSKTFGTLQLSLENAINLFESKK